MLDRKTEDRDASLELLEDRSKKLKYTWIIFFIIGWTLNLGSGLLAPYKYDEIGMNIGIALLVFATWFFIGFLYYELIIIIKNKMEVKNGK